MHSAWESWREKQVNRDKPTGAHFPFPLRGGTSTRSILPRHGTPGIVMTGTASSTSRRGPRRKVERRGTSTESGVLVTVAVIVAFLLAWSVAAERTTGTSKSKGQARRTTDSGSDSGGAAWSRRSWGAAAHVEARGLASLVTSLRDNGAAYVGETVRPQVAPGKRRAAGQALVLLTFGTESFALRITDPGVDATFGVAVNGGRTAASRGSGSYRIATAAIANTAQGQGCTASSHARIVRRRLARLGGCCQVRVSAVEGW